MALTNAAVLFSSAGSPYSISIRGMFSGQISPLRPSCRGQWWSKCSDLWYQHVWRKPTELATPFYSVLVSVSVYMALSIVFHSLKYPDNSPLSHSVPRVLFLSYWSFQLCICVYESLPQPTTRDFFLAYFCPSGPRICIFSKTSPDPFLYWLWLTPVPV